MKSILFGTALLVAAILVVGAIGLIFALVGYIFHP